MDILTKRRQNLLSSPRCIYSLIAIVSKEAMKVSSLVEIQEDVHSTCVGDIDGTLYSEAKYVSYGKWDDRDSQLRSIPRCFGRIKLI